MITWEWNEITGIVTQWNEDTGDWDFRSQNSDGVREFRSDRNHLSLDVKAETKGEATWLLIRAAKRHGFDADDFFEG